MSALPMRVLIRLLKLAGFLVSLMVVGIFVWAFDSRGLPDLNIWHSAELDSEFHVADIERMRSLADYLDREEQLFAELEALVTPQVPGSERFSFNRYYAGSVVYPAGLPQNFNRTFSIEPEGEPACGALLVHGLTDSPYSMRHVARPFVDQGCFVLALRMPGHGTIPAALARADFEDWQAAVALGADAVRARAGEGPVYLVGYSNGGALVVNEALDGLDDPSRKVDGLVLFSPMIGVTPFSRFADWGEILSKFTYFEKFAWLGVQPEFDPFKYNSFPKSAGSETFVVTQQLRQRLRTMTELGRLVEFPPVLSFQSLVDATVSMPAVVNELYANLTTPGSELVLFDLNRTSEMAPFLAQDHGDFVRNLLEGPTLTYDLTLISNVDAGSNEVAERRRRAESSAVQVAPLGVSWPSGTYSLSHVALVFPPEDQLYGTGPASDAAGLPRLGALNPRGERGVTSVPLDQLIRIRHNPFYDYVDERLRTKLAQHLAEW